MGAGFLARRETNTDAETPIRYPFQPGAGKTAEVGRRHRFRDGSMFVVRQPHGTLAQIPTFSFDKCFNRAATLDLVGGRDTNVWQVEADSDLPGGLMSGAYDDSQATCTPCGAESSFRATRQDAFTACTAAQTRPIPDESRASSPRGEESRRTSTSSRYLAVGRYCPPPNLCTVARKSPWQKKNGNASVSSMCRYLSGADETDTRCGPRLFPRTFSPRYCPMRLIKWHRSTRVRPDHACDMRIQRQMVHQSLDGRVFRVRRLVCVACGRRRNVAEEQEDPAPQPWRMQGGMVEANF